MLTRRALYLSAKRFSAWAGTFRAHGGACARHSESHTACAAATSPWRHVASPACRCRGGPAASRPDVPTPLCMLRARGPPAALPLMLRAGRGASPGGPATAATASHSAMASQLPGAAPSVPVLWAAPACGSSSAQGLPRREGAVKETDRPRGPPRLPPGMPAQPPARASSDAASHPLAPPRECDVGQPARRSLRLDERRRGRGRGRVRGGPRGSAADGGDADVASGQ